MQGGIKYHFFSLWYDSTWDWTSVSQTVGEHSTHLANYINSVLLLLLLLLLLFILLEFFTSVLADGFSLEFEWQQVSSSLQDSSQYSGNAVIWMVSTRPPTSKSSRPFNNPLVIVSKSTNHNWHNRHFNVPQLFQFSIKVEVLILLFTLLQIYSVVRRNSKVDNFSNSLLFVDYYKVWSSGRN